MRAHRQASAADGSMPPPACGPEGAGLPARPSAAGDPDGEPLPSGSPIGLVAGWGRYPVVVALRLREMGYRVVCLAVKGHADPCLEGLSDAHQVIGAGRLGKAIHFFQRHGVHRATMAGKLHKVLLFRRSYLLANLPDWTGVRTFFPHFVTRSQDRKDDTMLSAIIRAFAQHGIQFSPATDFAPELLVEAAHLAGPGLSFAQRKDAVFGWKLAKEIGRVDVGQSVAVKGQAVLAVEAIEGTDLCIRRAGQLCPSGGFTVVKVAKPQQDMRFDVPTIGMGTLRTMVEAGGRALIVEAQRTILLDRADVTQFAGRHGITLIALHETELAAWQRAA